MDISQQATTDYCSPRRIKWHFSPERSPYISGLWEATVKVVQDYFIMTAGSYRLTYEELSTVLCQIEAAGLLYLWVLIMMMA